MDTSKLVEPHSGYRSLASGQSFPAETGTSSSFRYFFLKLETGSLKRMGSSLRADRTRGLVPNPAMKVFRQVTRSLK